MARSHSRFCDCGPSVQGLLIQPLVDEVGEHPLLVDGQAVGPYDLITRSEIPVVLPSPEALAPDLSPLLPWLVSVFGSLGLQP